MISISRRVYITQFFFVTIPKIWLSNTCDEDVCHGGRIFCSSIIHFIVLFKTFRFFFATDMAKKKK